MTVKIICAFNNQEIFDNVVKNNENVKNCEVFAYDNTKENTAITKRYNDFIDTNVLSDVSESKDFWCVFIHQDFGFMEDVDLKFEKLSKDFIYGPIGAKVFKGFFFGKRDENKIGFKTTFKLILGEIMQGQNDFNLKKYGHKAFFKPTVDSVDCCCVIIHSSLIRKYNLRFDENLSFHMYAEELCYRAKKDYKIQAKVAQMKCFHLGKGVLNEEFYQAAQYLKDKFKIEKISSTCPIQMQRGKDA